MPGTVTGSPEAGVLEFDIPRGQLSGAGDPLVAEPAALWVETEVPTGVGQRAAVSNYFVFAAFLSSALEDHPTTPVGLDPAVASSAWGAVEAFATSSPFPLQSPLKAPSLAVANRGLVITNEFAVPVAVDGTLVGSVVDRVYLLAADLSGPSPGYVQIDRLSGTIAVYLAGGAALDIADPAWLGASPGLDDPGEPGEITVDLAVVAGALGLPGDATQLALSAQRTIELDDQRTIVAVATGATANSISEIAPSADVAPAPAPADVASTPADSAEVPWPFIGGVAAAVALIVVVALLIRRSRHQRSAASGRTGEASWAPESAGQGGRDQGGSSPDDVIAALEQQFADLGVGTDPSPSTDDAAAQDQPDDR